MYRCRHFKIEELVPPELLKLYGEEGCWRLLDERICRSADQFGDQFGPIVVNNWAAGGTYRESGLRDFRTATGAENSQHKFGRALDLKSKLYTPKQMADYLLSHLDRFPFVTTIEDLASTPTWLHIDCRNHGQSGILIVKP